MRGLTDPALSAASVPNLHPASDFPVPSLHPGGTQHSRNGIVPYVHKRPVIRTESPLLRWVAPDKKGEKGWEGKEVESVSGERKREKKTG